VTRGRKAYGTYPLGVLEAADTRAKFLSSVPDRLPRNDKLAGLPEVTSVKSQTVPGFFIGAAGHARAGETGPITQRP
jgi:hypothetical protein